MHYIQKQAKEGYFCMEPRLESLMMRVDMSSTCVKYLFRVSMPLQRGDPAFGTKGLREKRRQETTF